MLLWDETASGDRKPVQKWTFCKDQQVSHQTDLLTIKAITHALSVANQATERQNVTALNWMSGQLPSERMTMKTPKGILGSPLFIRSMERGRASFSWGSWGSTGTQRMETWPIPVLHGDWCSYAGCSIPCTAHFLFCDCILVPTNNVIDRHAISDQ